MTSETTGAPTSLSGAAEQDVVMLPASFSQELLWLIDRASPTGVAYNVPRTRRLRGVLDVAALRRAFDALVERHEILRTTYDTHEEQAVQVIHPPHPVPFDVVDLSALSADARDDAAMQEMRARGARPFDLAKDTLLRVTLIRLSDTDHVLLFESHHIAFDGWSRDIVFRELAEFYDAFTTGREPALPPLPIQYADFSIWQREQLQGERLESLLSWWRNELGDAEHTLRLPLDFPRPTTSKFEGVSRGVTLPASMRDAIRTLGQRHQATPYLVLLTAYAAVLHRYTGQPDILVGSPSAGRARPETEGLIGYFANTIVQRARFAGDPTFGQVLERLRESALGAYDHQDAPFEKMALELEGRASLGQSPIFQVVFTQLDVTQAPEARMGNVVLEPFTIDNATTKFDLTLFMSERPDRLDLALRGRTDLHRADTLERALGHIVAVLTAAIANPDVRVSEIDIAAPDERSWLDAQNATGVTEGELATVSQLFEAQARRVGTRAAVVAPSATGTGAEVTRTYADLEAAANQLAHHLRKIGITAGARVALGVDRSVEGLTAMLGIMKAGGAYVPISPELPAARREQLLVELGARALVGLASDNWQPPASITLVALDRDAKAIAAHPKTPPVPSATPNDPAYVLYTSGSTGNPKGVVVTHANIVHYARAVSRVLADVPGDAPVDGFAALDGWTFGMVTTLGADLGNTSLYVSVLCGGTLHMLGKDVATEPGAYAKYMGAHPIDVLKITPNHLGALTAGRGGGELLALLPKKWLVFGGEALRPDLVRGLLRDGTCRILNHYGPTETTVGVLTFEASFAAVENALKLGAQTVPLGRPLANTQVFVVSADGQEQPVSIPGELYIAGDGVAMEYLGQPEQTADRFVSFRGSRAYRSGDLVRRLPDGTIEFLGRVDDQVKVRGYRVELGEVAEALRAHPSLQDAVVILGAGTDPQLVGYAVVKKEGYAASHGERATSATLTEWLAARLPDYMVPSAIVLVDKLPLTANGKVDKARLPAPVANESREEDAYAAPRTTIEHELVEMWESLFPGKKIGIRHDFFELGGHSLLAIRLLGKIKTQRNQRLPMATLFDNATIEKLAIVIGNAVHAESEPPYVQLNPTATGEPFVFVHGDARGAGWYTRKFATALKGHGIIVLPTVRPMPGAPETIQDMARMQIASLRSVQPNGPYFLGGFCAGGLVALEMAQQLRAAGEEVPFLLLVDSSSRNAHFRSIAPLLSLLDARTPADVRLDHRAARIRRIRYWHLRWKQESRKSLGEQLTWMRTVIARTRKELASGQKTSIALAGTQRPAATDELALEEAKFLQGGMALGPGRDTLMHQSRAGAAYIPDRYPGRIAIITAVPTLGRKLEDPTYGWGAISHEIARHELQSTHVGLITRELAKLSDKVAEVFTGELERWRGKKG